MKIVVTGGTGFVGKHVLPLLNEMEIHLFSRENINLFDREAVFTAMEKIRPHYLLHIAWHTTPFVYWQSPENLLWLKSSLDLFEAFIVHGGKRAVGVGSCAEYAPSKKPCIEGITPVVPPSLYGACKESLRMSAERLCQLGGVSFAWARLFYPYGPHEKRERLIAYVTNSLLERSSFTLHAFHKVQDFIYIEDAARALVALLQSSVEGSVNIASGRGIPLGRVVQKIQEQFGEQPLEEPTVTEAESVVADITRLKEEVQWKPQISLEKGLEQTIAWWKHEAHY
ncbi:MAG: NAD-dependent epimerase/dehydratase family protein [Chlamydiales bacterium]